MAKNKGKFIVIEGSDGSGKATQTEILRDRLIKKGYKVKIVDFPQYGKKSAGLVEEYLNGRYGTVLEVGPYRASIFYACDRYDAGFQIKEWLHNGCIVIANRYTASNMAHQGGKIENALERKAFFDWVYDLEYNLFELPKPDINVVLYVEADIAQKLIDMKDKRNYIYSGKKDIHEKDIRHLENAEKIYLFLANSFPEFTLVKCTENNKILDKTAIHKKIWDKLESLLNSEKDTDKLMAKKIFPYAILPTWNHKNNAILNIFASEHQTLSPGEHNIIKTGVEIKIPKKYIAFIHGLSKMDDEGAYVLPRMLDSNFSGEIAVNFLNMSGDYYHIQTGQKIAQIVIQSLRPAV